MPLLSFLELIRLFNNCDPANHPLNLNKLKTMNSIGKECLELKQNYDACFNSWFSEKFLKGDTDDSECAPLFKIYQTCVKVSYLNNQEYYFILY